jgi:tRNA(Ile)-lysidine synthetase-like protein
VTSHPCESALVSLPQTLFVGVSGGVDSMVLLHALVASGRRPIVLHFDHGWREESVADAELVAEEAARLGLKFIGARMRPSKKQEARARAQRYAFFARSARKIGIFDLVLAHQADDQVETFVLQLLRGSGSAGTGMSSESRRDGLILHRPWLGVWKRDILAYARRCKIKWRDDATNADTRYRRNLVRHAFLPYLRRKFGAHVEANLWRAATIARAESDWLDNLCSAASTQERLAVRTLAAGPVAQQRRTLLRWLQARGVADISFADIESVRGLLAQRVPAKVNLAGGKFARRRAGFLFVESARL